jgi:hypothetical protein
MVPFLTVEDSLQLAAGSFNSFAFTLLGSFNSWKGASQGDDNDP